MTMKKTSKKWFGLVVSTRTFLIAHNCYHLEVVDKHKICGITFKEDSKEFYIPINVRASFEELEAFGEVFRELYDVMKELKELGKF